MRQCCSAALYSVVPARREPPRLSAVSSHARRQLWAITGLIIRRQRSVCPSAETRSALSLGRDAVDYLLRNSFAHSLSVSTFDAPLFKCV